ncbi:hypothetical protein F4809DRAFT_643727 [Biscogniauxia mediterranea]|nr:hypothetical protein F4809DRAFT_643727 [Biscogniauxia mediterranea]
MSQVAQEVSAANRNTSKATQKVSIDTEDLSLSQGSTSHHEERPQEQALLFVPDSSNLHFKDVEVTHSVFTSKNWISPKIVDPIFHVVDNTAMESIILNGKEFKSQKHITATWTRKDAPRTLQEDFFIATEDMATGILVTKASFDSLM